MIIGIVIGLAALLFVVSLIDQNIRERDNAHDHRQNRRGIG